MLLLPSLTAMGYTRSFYRTIRSFLLSSCNFSSSFFFFLVYRMYRRDRGEWNDRVIKFLENVASSVGRFYSVGERISYTGVEIK